MLEKYAHISFDLDGTLVHTLPEYRQKIVRAVVAELGKNAITSEAIDRFWYESGRDAIIQNELGVDPAAFWNLFHAKDTSEARSPHTHPYEDAESCIRRLKKSGKIISIITGAPRWIAEMEIKKLNDAPLDLYFSIHASNFSPKPDPRSFFLVLEKLRATPVETLYIGNSNEDAYFAKNAGVDFIYLERRQHQFDLREQAIATIHSLEELVK